MHIIRQMFINLQINNNTVDQKVLYIIVMETFTMTRPKINIKIKNLMIFLNI